MVILFFFYLNHLVIKRGKSILRSKKENRFHVNQMGEVIYKGHKSFGLMKQIQMGIRIAVLPFFLFLN